VYKPQVYTLIGMKIKRGKYRKKDSILVVAWLPRSLVAAVDLAVHLEDTDRSKFIRASIKERAVKLGIKVDDIIEVA